MVKKGGLKSKVLTITDKFTKWVRFFPIRDEKAKTIARICVDKWVSYWSVPELLITNNAVSFKTSEVMKNVYRLLAIDKKKNVVPVIIQREMGKRKEIIRYYYTCCRS